VNETCQILPFSDKAKIDKLSKSKVIFNIFRFFLKNFDWFQISINRQPNRYPNISPPIRQENIMHSSMIDLI
jgi:hypothetical protein